MNDYEHSRPSPPKPLKPPPHEYRSASCIHQMHKECRAKCKYCGAKCTCVCHVPKPVTTTAPTFNWLIYVLGLTCALLMGMVLALSWRIH